ncbi:hypothetical protein ACFVT2_39280 [Streptomyces sp. NPDC058000]|uniref:hypothetical protein n=1 Tax=Streptomyces sp. NPDC058000 TaxID=3346299 RepID=UPI0036E4807C
MTEVRCLAREIPGEAPNRYRRLPRRRTRGTAVAAIIAEVPACSASTASFNSASVTTSQSPSGTVGGRVRAQRAASRRENPARPTGGPGRAGPAPARLLAAAGLASTALSLLYLLFLVADTGGYTLGPLLDGRTLPWLGLQTLAATTVATTVTTIVVWWRRRDGSGAVRLAILLAGGLLFIPWALSWGLLLP